MFTLLSVLMLTHAQQTSVLAQEPKLAKRIEVRAEAESIQSLLERLSNETGTSLKVIPSIKDDLVVLYSDEPVQTTLEQLAKHFSWTWQRTTNGEYLLTQTSIQATAEKQTREEQILLPYLRWQKEAREGLALAKTVTQADYDRVITLSQEIQKNYDDAEEMNRLGTDAQKKEWIAKFQKLEAEKAVLSRKVSATWHLADEFVAGLTRQQLLQFDEDGKITAAYRQGRLQLPLTPGVLQAIDALIRTLPTVEFDTSIKEEWHRAEILRTSWLSKLKPENVANVVMVVNPFMPIEPDSSPELLRVQISMRHTNGNSIGTDYVSKRLWQEPATPKEKPHQPDELDQPVEMTEGLKDALINKFAPKSPLEMFRRNDSPEHPAKWKAHALVELAKAAKFDLISDCYDTPRWVAVGSFAVTPARRALKEFTMEDGADWTFQHGWVSIRSKYWQLSRVTTYSFENLKRIRDLLRLNPLSLDSYAEAISLGTTRQLRGTIAKYLFRWSPLKLEPDRNPTTLHALRLWGSLTPNTRKRLLAGETLRYGSLSPAQQNAVRLFIIHTEDRPWTMAVDFMEGYPPEQEEVEWIKKNWKATIEQYRPMFDATEYLPQGISPDTEIGFRKSSIPAVVASNTNGWSMSMSELSAIVSGYLRPEGTETLIVQTLQDLYTVSVWTPEKLFGRQIVITQPGRGEPKPFGQLPEEVKKRVRDAVKKRNGGG